MARSLNTVTSILSKRYATVLVDLAEQEKLLAALSLPAGVAGTPAALAAGLRGAGVGLIPAFFELLLHLQRAGRAFLLVFRTFGEDLPEIVFEQIEHFFTHYKDLEKKKWVRVGTWGDRDEARRITLEAIERYEAAKAQGEEPHDHDVPGRA